MTVVPDYLQKGDTVIFVATARKVSHSDVAFAKSLVESWGYAVVYAPNLFASHHQFAGTDAQRAADLQFALDHPVAKAIICVRGGYGTARIIDSLTFEHFYKNPKWVCGFSDVTVLLFHLYSLGFCSIHALMPLLFSKPHAEVSLQSLRKMLEGAPLEYHTSPHPLNQPGVCKGKLLGGNLSVIHSLLDTSSEPAFDEVILFIEDIDEYIYHIDRMWQHLIRTKKLSKIKGLIVGHFTDLKDHDIPFGKTVYEVIAEPMSACKIPVLFGFPTGHEMHNLALKIGAMTQLKVIETGGELTYLN